MIPNISFSWCRSVLSCRLWSVLLGLCMGLALAANPAMADTPSASAPNSTVEVERPQAGLPEANIAVGNQNYRIEVATTAQQAETGLMYRTYLAPGHGMLFTFNPPRPVSFWMKNTKIPLDILFVKQGRLVHVFEDARPCLSEPCPTYGVPDLIDMVLELPAGTAQHDHLTTDAPVQVLWPSSARQAVSQKGK